MYKVAALWLVNENKELLLAKRSDTKQHDPGKWGPSVTGKQEVGELEVEAVIRETEEELGLTTVLYKPEFLFEEDFVHPDGVTRRFSIYYATANKKSVDAALKLDSEEVAEIKWISKQGIRDLLESEPGEVITASAFALWEKVLQKLEAVEVL